MPNVYEKIQKIKEEIAKSSLKKSGKNTYAKYTYYELADFLPKIITLCNMNKLFTKISFNNEVASLEIINVEKPDEKVIYESPMRSLDLKGCNEIQALGGVETYSRRYLYMAAFDIVESDMLDGQANNQKPNPIKCEVCGKDIERSRSSPPQEIASKTKKEMGKVACVKCAQKWALQQKQIQDSKGEQANE